MPALRLVIDATRLFPGDMLDEMAADYFQGDRSGAFWLTAETGDAPCAVGYCAPERMTEGTWNMLLIAVHPDQQGSGIGRALMQRAQAEVRSRQGRLLLVETSGLQEFQGTRAFYRRIGFEQEAIIRDFYNSGEDKVIFRVLLEV